MACLAPAIATILLSAAAAPGDTLVLDDVVSDYALIEAYRELERDRDVERTHRLRYQADITRYTRHSLTASWRIVRVGARSSDDAVAGFMGLHGGRAEVVAGGLRLRWGEGALLGTSGGAWALPRPPNAGHVFDARPSMSHWWRSDGVAGSVALSSFRLSFASTETVDAGTTARWIGIERGGRTGAGVLTGEIESAQGVLPCVSAVASMATHDVRAGAELVSAGDHRVAVARIAGSAWRSEVFARTFERSLGGLALPVVPEATHGAGVRRELSGRRVRTTATLLFSETASSSRRERRERVELEMRSAPAGDVAWQCGTRRTRESGVAPSARSWDMSGTTSETTRWRTRARAMVTSGVTRHRFTTTWYFDETDRRTDVLASWEFRARAGPAEATAFVGAHSLREDGPAWILQGAALTLDPPVASGHSADVRLRVRLDAGAGATVTVTASDPGAAGARYEVRFRVEM